MSLSSSVLATPSDRRRAYVPARPADSANSSPVERTRTTIDDAEERERGFSLLRALQLGQLEPSQLKRRCRGRQADFVVKGTLAKSLSEQPRIRAAVFANWEMGGTIRESRRKASAFSLSGVDTATTALSGSSGRFQARAQSRCVRWNRRGFDFNGFPCCALPHWRFKGFRDENNIELQLKHLRILEWFVPEDIAPWAANF